MRVDEPQRTTAQVSFRSRYGNVLSEPWRLRAEDTLRFGLPDKEKLYRPGSNVSDGNGTRIVSRLAMRRELDQDAQSRPGMRYPRMVHRGRRGSIPRELNPLRPARCFHLCVVY